jgi:hypothetical protein
MNESIPPAPVQSDAGLLQPRSSWKRKLLMTVCVLFAIFGLATASFAVWYQYNFHASPFKPIALSAAEQQTLDTKMAVLGGKSLDGRPVNAPPVKVEQELAAPAPSDPAKTIVLNEREINAWLKEQGWGDNFQFQIRKSGFGATILTPVDEDTPLLGAFFAGHTVRVQVTFDTKLDENHHLALKLADLKIGGISIPNDWMGRIKDLDLLATSGAGSEDSPFVKGFAAGIKDFKVRDGELRMVLND